MYLLLTDTDMTTFQKWPPVRGKAKLEKKCQISRESSPRTGTEENLRVEVTADSDVRADDRKRGFCDTTFAQQINTQVP